LRSGEEHIPDQADTERQEAKLPRTADRPDDKRKETGDHHHIRTGDGKNMCNTGADKCFVCFRVNSRPFTDQQPFQQLPLLSTHGIFNEAQKLSAQGGDHPQSDPRPAAVIKHGNPVETFDEELIRDAVGFIEATGIEFAGVS
jgi:hypothetical protein